MSSHPYVTRFAPSPTGALHLGNARTALFNDLAARASGGRLVLRIEDTDAERSEEALLQRLLEDLRWLGLEWAEGPDVGGPHAPYRQSERAAQYAHAVAMLEAQGRVYPCFCSPEELKLSRRAQLAAGRPPRYAGTCASPVGRRGGAPQGDRGTARAAVSRAGGRKVEFTDLIHGEQRFATDDIGDFVILRADGSVAFFLGNAVDDADMGITLVLRGDDHLANTPRQILLLEALGRPAPQYGHLPLLLGASGAPLSKRDGAASLRDLRSQGYLPGALRNYLVRLGHACGHDGWLETAEMPRYFDLARSSRSAAHFDEAQLRHWQREALVRARKPTCSLARAIAWLRSASARGGRHSSPWCAATCCSRPMSNRWCGSSATGTSRPTTRPLARSSRPGANSSSRPPRPGRLTAPTSRPGRARSPRDRAQGRGAVHAAARRPDRQHARAGTCAAAGADAGPSSRRTHPRGRRARRGRLTQSESRRIDPCCRSTIP